MSEVLVWRHEDRKQFPAGPWDDEPDKVQWVDKGTDLDCLIVRGPVGALCGYVGVPPSHPWHGHGYSDVDYLDVHGGLTFSDACDEDAREGHGICHVPFPGREPRMWWFGFDCAHAGDLTPSLRMFDGDVYRTVAYVTSQCELLAAQLVRVERAPA